MIVNSKIAFFAKNFSLCFFVLQSCDICVIIMSQHIQEGANMNTGARIKARRQELGLSVDELADKLGKNRATIYIDTRAMTLRTCRRRCWALCRTLLKQHPVI